MNTAIQVALLTLALSGMAFASDNPVVPEIDPSSAAVAVGVLAGGLLLIRARRKQ